MKSQEESSKEEWPALVSELIRQAQAGNKDSIPKILEWLQDVNWPGADLAMGYLNALGDDVVPYVADVLDGTDEVWQYWILHCMVKQWPLSRIQMIYDKLVMLSNVNDYEHVNLAAIEVLISHRLYDRESLTARLNQIHSYRPNITRDINELKNMILQQGSRKRG